LPAAARDASREMIDHLMQEYVLSPEQSYCLCSGALEYLSSSVRPSSAKLFNGSTLVVLAGGYAR
jgi:hypothetical protein